MFGLAILVVMDMVFGYVFIIVRLQRVLLG
jgi:hypothetical protein